MLMKTKIITGILALALCSAHSDNYYWNGTSNGNSAANWTTSIDGGTAMGSGFTFATDSASANNMYIGNVFTTAQVDLRTALEDKTYYIGALGNASTHAATTMDIIMGNGAITDPLLPGKIVTFASITQNSDTVAMKIRKGQSNTTFNVSVGAISVLKNKLTLGGTGSQDMTDLVVTGTTTVSGTASLDVYAGNMDFKGLVTLGGSGILNVIKSTVAGGSATVPPSPVVKFGNINVSGAGRLIFGSIADTYNIMQSIDIAGISYGALTGDSASTFRATDDISLGAVSLANTDKKVVLYVRSDTGKVKLSSLEIGKSSNMEFSLYNFATHVEIGSVEFKSTELGGSYLNVSGVGAGGSFTITGNLTNNIAANDGSTANIAYVRSASALAVKGMLDNGSLSHALLLESTGAANSSVTVSVGGIIGGNGSEGNRIATSGGTNNKNVEIKITGSSATAGKTYVYSSRIHDISGGTTYNPLTQIAEGRDHISITMDAVGYKQYLTGPVYIMGTTAVKNGQLFITSDHGSQKKYDDGTGTLVSWGLNLLSLEGGGFGACGTGAAGSVSEIGNVIAYDMNWSGGQLLVDVGAGKADKVIVQNMFTLSDAGGVYDIVISFEDGAAASADIYQILQWESSADTYTKDNFSVSFEGNKAGQYELFVDEHGVSIRIDAIPEPAEYAALLGLCALLFALRRKRLAKRD